VRTIELRGKSVVLIDQTQLPGKLKLAKCSSADEIARAIRTMQIRGAPVLGVAAAFALAVTALRSRARSKSGLLRELERAAKKIRQTRPTAVNLFVGLDRVLGVARKARSVQDMREVVVREAKHIADKDVETNKQMGQYGASLIQDGNTILTHCNTGALATVDYGTALGAIRAAWSQGKRIRVVATETRPRLQGARLTAWELKRAGIPVTVITDNMAGALMSQGRIDLVMVGADRIAVNGDVINKVGTYTLAVLAKEHGVPFYVVAPTSTIDRRARRGSEVLIEHRDSREVIFIGMTRLVPKGVKVLNPAFDLTPARLVTAIVTERGIVRPTGLKSLFA
jgi:methylthioribose-1-phosphate isomerase